MFIFYFCEHFTWFSISINVLKIKEKSKANEKPLDWCSTVIIGWVPSLKIPVFLAQHRPERDSYRIENNHPFILADTEINQRVKRAIFIVVSLIKRAKVGEKVAYFAIVNISKS